MNEYSETENIKKADQEAALAEKNRQLLEIHTEQYNIAVELDVVKGLSQYDLECALRCWAETTGSMLGFWEFLNKLHFDNLEIAPQNNECKEWAPTEVEIIHNAYPGVHNLYPVKCSGKLINHEGPHSWES